MSLRLKLLILFLVLALIPTIFISVLTFTDYKNALEYEHLSTLRDIATFKSDKIELIFTDLKKNIKMSQSFWNIKNSLPILIKFSHDISSQEFVKARETLDGQLQPMQAILGLDSIMLLDTEGDRVYSTNTADAQKKFLNPLSDPGQKVFKEGEKGIYFSDVFLNKEENNSLDMFISAPALDSQGALIGVIVFDVNMPPVYKLIQDNAGLGNTGETAIGKKVGDWVVYLNQLKYDPDAALKKKIKMGDHSGVPMQKAVLGEEGVGPSIDYRGTEVISAWRSIPSLGWGMVVKIDKKEAFEAVTKLKYLVIMIMGIVFIMLSVIALAVSHAITGPIGRVAKCAEAVGAGNLDCRADVNTKDEVGKLAQTFNKMIEDLKSSTISIDRLNKEIDQRKEAERTSRLLAAIVESSEDAIIGKNMNDMITSWNKGATHLYGYTEKEALGKNISIIVPPEHGPELIMITNKVTNDQKVEHFETIRKRKDGVLLPVLLSISPIKDSDGKIVGASAIAHDITERKRLEELLKKYNEELEKKVEERTYELRESQDKLVRSEKLAIVGKLASSVAHELRNPLGVIKNVVYYLGMLDQTKDNPEVKENLDIITQEIDNSDKIITDLLDFSRAKTPVFLPENINLIIKEVLDRIRIGPEIELILGLKDGLPNIEVDALQMHQVFYNLIKNALDAMEKGGKLTVMTAMRGEFIEVTLSDTGSGIPKENITKIFEPLFSTKTKGTGLGLSVCASLVERHNGKIEVESEVGKGTTFIVKLPVKRG